MIDGGTLSFDCEVVDYQCSSGDPNFYNNHVFTIKIWIQQHMYAIERSYASFCELDWRLRKQYARSNLPVLKLAGVSQVPKYIKNTNTIKDAKLNQYPPELEGDRNHPKLLRKFDNKESIGQKKKYLTMYLQALLKIPEVVLSDAMLYFLDEESIHGEIIIEQTDEQPDSKEINLLLSGLEMTTRTVRADRHQEVTVPANSFVVWAFHTVSHDIGFSIIHEKKEIFKYQRCDSHQKVMKGHFEMRNGGNVSFIWDNSYSRWRSKTVHYVIRVVTAIEYEEARNIAIQQKKDKALFLLQRNMMKTTLTTLSANLLEEKGYTIAATAIPNLVPMSRLTHSDGIGSGLSRSLSRTDSEVESALSVENATTVTSTTIATATADPSLTHTQVHNNNNTTTTNKYTHNQTRYTHTDTSEFMDLSEAVREVQKLRNEKKTLQQALGESETALVTERNITAQYIEKYDIEINRSSLLNEELVELKAEFELFRENYFNEMEARLTQTLAQFTATATSAGSNTSTNVHNEQTINAASSTDGGDLDASLHSTSRDGPHQLAEAPLSAASASHQITALSTPTTATEHTASLTSAIDSNNCGSSSKDEEQTAASLNFLISLSQQDLSKLSSTSLVSYYMQLNEYTLQMLRRGYLTKDMERMFGKLKNEKKQLKAYAIQMKQSLDKLSTQYIHIDQDKTLLLSQVKELKDIVTLLEADRRGLRETISVLTAAETNSITQKQPQQQQQEHSEEQKHPLQQQMREEDSHDSAANMTAMESKVQSVIVGETESEGERPSAIKYHGRSFSAGSMVDHSQNIHMQTQDHHHYRSRSHSSLENSSQHSTSEGALSSLWPMLNSGLASATAAAMSFQEIFEDDTVGTTSAAGVSHTTGGTSTHKPSRDATTASSSSLHHPSCSSSDDHLDLAPSSRSTIVISMEDLKGAESVFSLPGKARLQSRHRGDGSWWDDTGSDCGYSVKDEDGCSDAGDALGMGVGMSSPLNRRGLLLQSSEEYEAEETAVEVGASSSMSSTVPPSQQQGAVRLQRLGSGSSSDDGSFSKVTGQLIGILPTWSQINAFRNKSLI